MTGILTDLETKKFLADNKVCVIIPTYNNEGTISDVVQRTLNFCESVIVVDDGCTDSTVKILQSFSQSIIVVSNGVNKGKGCALKAGFKKALELGFLYAITLDADGQHYPEDIPMFAAKFAESKGSMLIGTRNLKADNMPSKNTFANKFSNFWFCFQTFHNLKDTQTGYRLYPLKRIGGLKLLTSRYEAELELLVFTAWRRVDIKMVPINVYYPPAEERVSHFRPLVDFTRISILNVILCIFAIFYGWPMSIIGRLCR